MKGGDKMKKAIMYVCILVMFTLLLTMGTGATQPVRSITVEIGSAATKAFEIPNWLGNIGVIDKIIPISLNIHISLERLSQGCNGTVPEELDIPFGGRIHVYYNPNTGELWARWENATTKFVYNPEERKVIAVE
jgi:hypothetical protein